MGQYGFVTLQVTGAAAKRRKFATWGETIHSLAPAWELIAEDLRNDAANQFTAEGGVFRTGHWAPLRPATVKDRQRKGYPGAHPILQRRGDLLQSLTQQGATGHTEEITATSLTFGTRYPTAAFHQFGTRKMAARQILGISWQRQSGIVQRLNEYIQQTIRGAGLQA